MLYIIYCKPDKKQGKKEFIKLLKKEFGVKPISKYTHKSDPKSPQNDENLIYINAADGEISSKDDFLKAVNKNTNKNYTTETFYIYERKSKTGTNFYGISQESIWESLDSSANHALVCTNIEIIRRIKKDAEDENKLLDEEYRPKMFAYCLVRKEDGSTNDQEVDKSLTIKELKDLLNKEKPMPDWLEKADDDSQTIVLSYGEARELDFFRYLIEFSNLLIIKSYSDFKNNKHEYVKDVCELVEKYIGLKRIRKNPQKVFVIHPMSNMKFAVYSDFGKQNAPILSDTQSEANSLFKKMLYFCFGNNDVFNLTFADEIKDNHTKKEGSIELTKAILNEIDKSDIIIGDLRNLNHNCIYEIGYALGKEKKVYIIWPHQQFEIIKGLLFDISTYAGAGYDLNNLINVNTIADALKALINNFGIEFANNESLFKDGKLSSKVQVAFAHDTKFEEFKKIYEEAVSY